MSCPGLVRRHCQSIRLLIARSFTVTNGIVSDQSPANGTSLPDTQKGSSLQRSSFLLTRTASHFSFTAMTYHYRGSNLELTRPSCTTLCNGLGISKTQAAAVRQLPNATSINQPHHGCLSIRRCDIVAFSCARDHCAFRTKLHILLHPRNRHECHHIGRTLPLPLSRWLCCYRPL